MRAANWGGGTYRVARYEVLFAPRRARARALVVRTGGARGVVVGLDVSRPTVARLREGPLVVRVGVRLARQRAGHRRERVEGSRGARRRLRTRGALCDPPGARPVGAKYLHRTPRSRANCCAQSSQKSRERHRPSATRRFRLGVQSAPKRGWVKRNCLVCRPIDIRSIVGQIAGQPPDDPTPDPSLATPSRLSNISFE